MPTAQRCARTTGGRRSEEDRPYNNEIHCWVLTEITRKGQRVICRPLTLIQRPVGLTASAADGLRYSLMRWVYAKFLLWRQQCSGRTPLVSTFVAHVP